MQLSVAAAFEQLSSLDVITKSSNGNYSRIITFVSAVCELNCKFKLN